ncbi:VOC family protein [Nocardioides sp. 503]|uniref:VOC family protein n=1 Tax=Nocardioides sp. 503 TaxID=2508326 RepID=UPI00106FDCBC|nr:VOC family protein [Nocardioides sp. 503]
MTARLAALSIDALDPQALGRFWAGLLGWETGHSSPDLVSLTPPDDAGFRLQLLRTQEPKTLPNQMHFDLTSTSLEQQEETVGRALALGARRLDIGQGPDATHVVLADPEGNEFDVIEPGNNFLAGCGFIGAISSDGTQQVGYFWSQALGWPLVWDQDEETAIQSPRGGTKITWGGPPVRTKMGKNRLHFDLVAADGDQQAEVERLLSLGATHADIGQGDVDWVVLADPDGNELCVLASA